MSGSPTRPRARLVTALGALLLVTVSTRGAHAQQSPDASRTSAAAAQSSAPVDPTVREARAAFERGIEMSQQERWGEALDAFRRSFELVPRPSTAFNMASTLVRLGRHVEAVAAYEHYLRIADASAEGARFTDAQTQLTAERAMVATLELAIAPETAELRLDGRRVEGLLSQRALSVDPGAHTIEVSAPRHRAFSTTVRVASGERSPVRVSLEAITTARLEVQCTVPGAVITVDGAPFTTGGREVGAGAHEINVTAAGYEPFRRRVTLAPEATLRVDASLTRVVVVRPLHANPLFWVAIAGGTAVIATSVVLGVVLSGQAPEFATSTGITIQALSGGAARF
jgi:PEGA domain